MTKKGEMLGSSPSMTEKGEVKPEGDNEGKDTPIKLEHDGRGKRGKRRGRGVDGGLIRPASQWL